MNYKHDFCVNCKIKISKPHIRMTEKEFSKIKIGSILYDKKLNPRKVVAVGKKIIALRSFRSLNGYSTYLGYNDVKWKFSLRKTC